MDMPQSYRYLVLTIVPQLSQSRLIVERWLSRSTINEFFARTKPVRGKGTPSRSLAVSLNAIESCGSICIELTVNCYSYTHIPNHEGEDVAALRTLH